MASSPPGRPCDSGIRSPYRSFNLAKDCLGGVRTLWCGTNIAVWDRRRGDLGGGPLVVVVVTGHRQGDKRSDHRWPGAAVGPRPRCEPPLAGLGLGPEFFRPEAPEGRTPRRARPRAALSSAERLPASRSGGLGCGQTSSDRRFVPQVTCQPSILQTVLGLITSLLGGGGILLGGLRGHPVVSTWRASRTSVTSADSRSPGAERRNSAGWPAVCPAAPHDRRRRRVDDRHLRSAYGDRPAFPAVRWERDGPTPLERGPASGPSTSACCPRGSVRFPREDEDPKLFNYRGYLAHRPENVVARRAGCSPNPTPGRPWCTARPARTAPAWFCALVSDAVGVSRDAVVQDYTMSNDRPARGAAERRRHRVRHRRRRHRPLPLARPR